MIRALFYRSTKTIDYNFMLKFDHTFSAVIVVKLNITQIWIKFKWFIVALWCHIWHGRIWLSLGQVMTCCLFGARALAAIMTYCQLNRRKQISLEIWTPWKFEQNADFFHRRIADVCFELHFRVTPGQFRPAAASSLHRRLALLATSTRPSFSKNAYLGILFAPMYQKYSLDFVSFGFYSNIQIV